MPLVQLWWLLDALLLGEQPAAHRAVELVHGHLEELVAHVPARGHAEYVVDLFERLFFGLGHPEQNTDPREHAEACENA